MRHIACVCAYVVRLRCALPTFTHAARVALHGVAMQSVAHEGTCPIKLPHAHARTQHLAKSQMLRACLADAVRLVYGDAILRSDLCAEHARAWVHMPAAMHARAKTVAVECAQPGHLNAHSVQDGCPLRAQCMHDRRVPGIAWGRHAGTRNHISQAVWQARGCAPAGRAHAERREGA